MSLEMAELAKRLPGMAFSKIAGVAALGDEEGLDFIRSLYHATVLAKDDGDWTRVERFLGDWETKLISRARPNALRFESSPWHPFEKPLSQARIALIGTGGIYMKGTQEPYDTDGDASFRTIATTAARGTLAISHTHYDTSGAIADINVVFPYERLKEMERDGLIGSFSDTAYGFMGYIVREQVDQLINETAPEVADRIVADGVDAVLIGTT